jgi:transcriptional regulator with XRE-family HTH domain
MQKPSALTQNIGRRIGELRAKRDLTQAKLAEKIGRSLLMVQIWERGINFKVETLFMLAKALDYRIQDFFKLPTTKKPKPGRPKHKKSSS